MKKQQIQTAILLVVLGGLIAWYFGYEKKMRVDNESTAEKKKQLVPFGKDEIEELTLEKKGSPAIKLRKSGDKWSLLAPLEDTADTPAISNLISTLTTTKYEDVVEENASNLEKYGLKEPALKVSVKKIAKPNEEATEEVAFGNDTAVGNGVYFMTKKNGKAVYRVSNYIKTTFDKAPKDLRNRSIVEIPRTDLTEVEIKNSKGSVLMARDGEKDLWTLPRELLAADTAESGKLLNTILDSKATDFADDTAPISNYGLNSPKIQITLKLKDKSNVSLQIGKGKDKDKFYLKRGDKKTIFEIAKDTFDKLDVDSASLRTKEVASINRFDIRKIRIERPTTKDSVDLSRTDLDWEIVQEPGVKLDNTKVDSFLTAIQDAKITKYGAKGKVAAPALTIRLFEKKDKTEIEKVVLKLQSPKGGQSLVERNGLDLLFNVAENDFKKFDQKRADFLKIEKAPEAGKAPATPGKSASQPEPKRSE